MTHTIWHLAGTTRRSFLGTTAAAGAAGLILPAPYVKRAYAQARSTMIFASGEPLTGNWDPTSHTQLAQINFEGFVFGKLFNTPMRPEKPDEIVWDLAPSQKVIDLHTMEYKLRDGVTFHDGEPFTAEDVKATFEYASQAEPAGRLVSRPLRGRGRRQADRARPHREGRLPGLGVLLPGRLPADHVGRRHQGPEDAAGAAERHRAVQVRRAAGQHHDHGRLRRVLGRAGRS